VLLRANDQGELMLADGSPLSSSPAAGLCTLLLPASLCSITAVDVGAGEARLLRKTLPWRLEDTLLEAPETLHFAHGDVSEGRAAITLARRSALDQLRRIALACGLVPQTAVAELSLVPWQRGQWTLWLHDLIAHRVLVRHGWHQGFVCEVGNLADALSALHNEQQAWPAEIVLYGTQAQYADIRQRLPLSLQPLLVLRRPAAWEELFATSNPACNVLQGAYAPPLPWQRWWRQWRVAALLLAATVSVDAAATLINTGRLQAQQTAAKQQIIGELRRVQPQGAVVDPLRQLQQLAAAGGGAHALLPLLTRMAPALRGESGITVELLDFDGATGTLQLDVHGQNLAAIENLRGKLQATGLAVDLLGSASEAGTSRARLRVAPGAGEL
jgi:type II secretion system protein L